MSNKCERGITECEHGKEITECKECNERIDRALHRVVADLKRDQQAKEAKTSPRARPVA